MPAEGKRPLNDDQVAALKWWIDTGAPVQGTISEYGLSPTNKNTLLALLGLDDAAFDAIAPLDDVLIAQLQARGLLLKPSRKMCII